MHRTGAYMTPSELDEARRAYLASGGTVTPISITCLTLRIGTKFNPAIAERRAHIEARSLGMGKMALVATAYELGVSKC